MTKTEKNKLLKYVKALQLSPTSIGIYVYLQSTTGIILTYGKISEDMNLSVNTIHKHINQLKKLNIIEKVVTQRGILFTISPTKNWDTNAILNTNTIIDINHLNQEEDIILSDIERISGRTFRRKNTEVVTLIRNRLSDGYTVEDFFAVHRNKSSWLESDEWSKYFRPQTLYTPNHFAKYLEEGSAKSLGTARLQTTEKWNTAEAKQKMKKKKEKLRREFDV